MKVELGFQGSLIISYMPNLFLRIPKSRKPFCARARARKIEDERSSILDFYTTPTELTKNTAAAVSKTRISKIFKTKVLKKYPKIFIGSDREIQLKGNVVAYVVSQLQRYSLLESPVDVKGVAYEEIVGSNLRGDRGEFFTPRNACRMAVKMINPQPTEYVLDPACGTGGFLITAMNHSLHILEEYERTYWVNLNKPTNAERAELYRKRSEYLNDMVFGLDLNPALVRAAKMNMVMNNDGEGDLFQANSLAHPHTWDQEVTEKIKLASYDVIFTNPPFGANIIINDEEILSQYDLAAVWDKQDDGSWEMRLDKIGNRALQKSLPPEILFIERCIQFLNPGTGRMAMVIPNGILNNPALGYVRQWILSNSQILAVIDMARDLFQPKNDTQTSMVLLRRLSETEKIAARDHGLSYPVFMAIAEKIGHDKRGNIIYKRAADGKEILVSRKEKYSEINENGDEIQKEVEVKERLMDDELPEVANVYLEWLEDRK